MPVEVYIVQGAITAAVAERIESVATVDIAATAWRL